VRVKCGKVSWIIGDSVYAGRSKIWLKDNKRGELRWNYAYRIKPLNEFCAIDNPRSQRTKTYVVR
jgi:hypothetical protein